MDVHWVGEKAIWFARSPALHGNPGWGVGTPLQEANGDVPLDGVTLSRLERL